MHFPDPTPRLTLGTPLEFEAIFKNTMGEEIAGIWFIDGGWQISTEPLLRFPTKTEALEAWETRFNHHSGLLCGTLVKSYVGRGKRRRDDGEDDSRD
jgi:hypothetical protein